MSQSFVPGSLSMTDALRTLGQAIAVSQFEEAARLADSALAQGLAHPAFFNAKALWLERQGRDEDALAAFEKARLLGPKDPTLLNAIALCLTRLFRLDDAIRTFEEAIRIAPANSASYQRKGVALGLAGRREEAERAFRRAIQLDPRNAEALAGLAAISARKGDAIGAMEQARRALAIDARNATAAAAVAQIEISKGEFAAAEARLKPLLPDPNLVGHGRAAVFGLLGDALDGLDSPDEAFAAYKGANDLQEKLHAGRFRDGPRTPETVARLTTRLEAMDAAAWRSPVGDTTEGVAREHAFLLGFHRSGTTLLGQILESHPGIAALEERDFLVEPAERYLTGTAGLDALAAADESVLTTARAEYWRRVRGLGIGLEGKVFVDKHPFNTIKLPLIAKLFPDAKILLAIRDPRDVVLSCYRRRFEVDAVKIEFLSLERIARLYDLVMRFADVCREKLPLAFLEHRYEDMVEDFDGRTRAVCDFLGVPWNESLRDFAATARGTDIRSPSADQVRRGLYTEGVAQWRRYEKHLRPVMPILKPWIARFGYPPE